MVDRVFLNIYSNLGEYLSFSISSFVQQLLFHSGKRLQKNSYEQTLYGCWQEIPSEIIGIIVQRLTLSDRIHLGLVCKSWRSLAMHKDICPDPQLPWLTIPRDRNNENLVTFYDLNIGKVHNMKLPKILQGAFCWGCSKGFLIMSKERTCLDSSIMNLDVEIFLFNPISREIHQLPSLSTLQSYYPQSWHSHNINVKTSSIIHRIELSSKDTSECIVGAVLQGGWDGVYNGLDGLVAFCRPRDKQWSIFRGKDDKEGYNFRDILFCKGSFYALIHSDSDTEHVENHTIGLVDSTEVSFKIIHDLNDYEGYEIEFLNDNFGTVTGLIWDPYLVESTNSELLLICRRLDVLCSTNDDDLELFHIEYQKTNAFIVFKLDPNTGHLNRLQTLGDEVLFLAYGGSQSCLAKDFSGFQGNCIYFVDDLNYLFHAMTPLLSRESGVYYLEDGRIERSFPTVQFPLQSRMSWFTPVL